MKLTQKYLRMSAAFVVVFAIWGLAGIRAAEAGAAKFVPALGWQLEKQGGFPVSIAADKSGNIWVGTEGNGLWRRDAANKEWTQFTRKDGLGDDCVYALAVDGTGRVWAGHLNHGVSVYDGSKWKNYGMLNGPLGDRVFAIAVSPKDGDVWMATDMGLARYSDTRKDWDYYTRASGLPSDQIETLAFEPDGRLYAGTQCNGIAIGGREDNYAKWRVVTSPRNLRASSMGEGLVSELINSLYLVHTSDGTPLMIAATPAGASATSDGNKWVFVRRQYADKPSILPAGEGFAPGVTSFTLPPEDWITSLASDGSNLWIGCRKAGAEERGLTNLTSVKTQVQWPDPKRPAWVRAILALPNEPPLFATYDEEAGGLMTVEGAPEFSPIAGGTAAAVSGTAPLPSEPATPTVDDAKALSVRLGKLTQQTAPGEAYFLADDWRTEGDWIGRYGGGYTKLCGMSDNGDQEYSLQSGYSVTLDVGPHFAPDAKGPVWYHADEISFDLRSLYDPTLGHRRDAEKNDRSYDTKHYPESYDGPDLWVKVTVPDGVHCLSFYFVNNDAQHRGDTKYRDYDVQVYDAEDQAKIGTAAPLARTRVTDFWGGVYKQFLICGPSDYIVKIGRDHSAVTKLQGVFLDRVTGDLTDNPKQLPGFDTSRYAPPDEPDDLHPGPLADAAINLWNQLDDALGLRGSIPLQMPLRIWCYRAAVAGNAPAAVLERWRWQISIWTPEDRNKFDAAVKAAYDAAK